MNQPETFSPLQRAMLYVVRRLGEVGVMKLEKILYLADLEHFYKTGQSITRTRWVRQQQGPVAKAVLPASRPMQGREFTITERPVPGGHISRIYQPGPHARAEPELDETERQTLDQIIEMLRNLSATQAGRLAYETTPMLERLQAEAQEGQPIYDHPLRLGRSERDRVRAARRTARVTAARRREFKQAELARVADLNEVALANR